MKKLIASLLLVAQLLTPFQALAAVSNSDRAILDKHYNRLTNPGFEASYAGWATSAVTPVVVSAAANVGSGDRAISWDSTAAAQTFSSGYVTITSGDGLSSQPGAVSCRFKAASGTATHTLEAYDGTNKLVSSTITSSTTGYVRLTANFLFPASGTVRLQISSVNANEPNLYIDDCYLGLAEGWNVSNITQTQLIGDGYFAQTASCIPARTSATLGAFSTSATCVGPTVVNNPGPGTIATTDADLPQFTVTSLPPGYYEVKWTFSALTAGSDITVYYAVNDGTTTSGQVLGTASVGRVQTTVVGYFNYTSAQATKTFALWGGVAGGDTVKIDDSTAGSQLNFSITRYPQTPEQNVRMDQLPASWSGYHDSTCAFARTNTGYGDPTADTTCVFTERTNRNFGTVTSYKSGSDFLPGIVFTPSRAGMYYVCANTNASTTVAAAGLSFKLSDGTTTIAENSMRPHTDGATSAGQMLPLCGVYNATSTAAKTISIQTAATSGAVTIQSFGISAATINWSIFALDQSYPQPYLQPLNRTECTHLGGNGYGSGSTKIPKFTTNTCTGSDVTYSSANDATLGVVWTIAAAGVYCMSYSVEPNSATANTSGFSKNSSQLTTSLQTITAADRLAFETNNNGTVTSKTSVSVCTIAAVGDVLRPHTDGYTNDGTTTVARIVKVSN